MKKQPQIDIQRELDALANDKPEVISIPYTHRKVKVGWLKKETIRKITGVLLSEKKSSKYECQVSCRMAALILLNDYWRIKLFYPILWRWMYYVKQYNDYQLLPIVEVGKKKATPIPSWLIMTYLHGFNDTLATMTREEVGRTRQEPSSGKEAN